MATPVILLIVDPFQSRFVPYLKGVAKARILVHTATPESLGDLTTYILEVQQARNVKITGIATSSNRLLYLLLKQRFPNEPEKLAPKKATCLNYKGAMFYHIHRKTAYGIVVLPELNFLTYKNFGKHLFSRYLGKLTSNEVESAPKLHWHCIQNRGQFEEAFEQMQDCTLMAIDVETRVMEAHAAVQTNPAYDGLWSRMSGKTKSGGKAKRMVTGVPYMDMYGVTCLYQTDEGLHTHTYIIDVDSMEAVGWIRKINLMKQPKILQNGKYDMAYFFRYGAPVQNYVFDTYIAMHSYYVEMPRTLDFLSSYFLKNHMYWKDESGSRRHYYCAQDCHATMWIWIFMMQEYPDWAHRNYAENFKQVFPALTSNMEGFKVNVELMQERKKTKSYEIEDCSTILQRMTATPNLNPNSPPQIKALMTGLGFTTNSSDDKAIKSFRNKNPMFDRIGEMITKARKGQKAKSNYYDFPLLNGRMLYSQNPAGTDTGRYSTNASDFWVGTQVQNIPFYAKDIFIADEGWLLGAIDNSQSESRCTAYIAEDFDLIDAVENSLDFHYKNCSAFFGIPENELHGGLDENGEIIHKRKDIRNLGKRVNHGANYNMGAQVLLDTMGVREVINAKHLLKMPSHYTMLQVCAKLLKSFDEAYPKLKGKYYPEVCHEVESTRMLVGATGWTRYCFGRLNLIGCGDKRSEASQKLQLNSYVAHPPQSLSVKLINAAFYKVWLKLQIKEGKIRIKGQVHDEIIFQYKRENEDYVFDYISKTMAEPVMIRGREMIIPNDQCRAGQTWADIK